MKIYIVRHGETNWNKERKIQGRSDIALNEFGRMLAKKTAVGLADIVFTICYTSPLWRAKETAEIILEGQTVPIVESEGIMEMAFGAYEGLCCSKQGWNVPEKFQNFFYDPEHYEAPEGAEHFTDVVQRTGAFLEALYQDKELQTANILITTHGAALAAMLQSIKKEPIANFWGTGVHKNCAVTEIEVTNHIPVIISENMVYYDDVVTPWAE